MQPSGAPIALELARFRFQRKANPGMFILSEGDPERVCKTEH
jgi:hypothetical protein